MSETSDQFLPQLVQFWTKLIDRCRKRKKQQFGDVADRLWKFRSSEYPDLAPEMEGIGEEFADSLGPLTKRRVNLVAQYVRVMLPYVNEKMPVRTVQPRLLELPPDLQMLAPNSGPRPEDRLRASLLQYWLNYLPGEYGAYREQRMAIEEAMVKGRGVCWHEMVEASTGTIPASYYVSVDDVLLDPDCTCYREAGYLIRRRRQQIWAVNRKFGTPIEELRKGLGRARTELSAAGDDADDDEDTDSLGEKSDVVTYYEVWSRIGFGKDLSDAPKEVTESGLEAVGQHVYLAILPGLEYPLNMPGKEMEEGMEGVATLAERVAWPVACYAEPSNPWPCSFLDFHPSPDNPWADAPLRHCEPIMEYIDRIYRYVLSHVKKAGRGLIFISKELELAVQDAVIKGIDMEVFRVSGVAGQLDQHIWEWQAKGVLPSLWQVLEAAERKFELMSGMDPLMQGGQPDTQPRSATEMDIRDTRMSSRPDDYADAVMEWNSRIAAKEAQLSRMYVGPETVAPMFNEAWPEGMDQAQSPEQMVEVFLNSPLSYAWATMVNTEDESEAAAEMAYTCESGKGQRRNRQMLVQNGQFLAQTLLQPYLQLAMGGQIDQYNSLLGVLSEMLEIPQLNGLAISLPPMPVMPGGEEAGVEEETEQEAATPVA